MRKPLQNIIFKSWKQCIASDYVNQRINSERSLQASFWSFLNKNIQKNRRLFIESPMTVKTGNKTTKVIPDIIICSAYKVIAVIELKYLPRGQPKYTKDIKTLAFISSNRNKIRVSNKRFRGDAKERTEYSLSSNILFVWASVHAKEKTITSDLYSSGYKSLTDCFIQLHAATEDTTKPNVYMC